MDYRVWLVATLKGGVRKTTTAMMLAFAMGGQDDVLVIDADTGTQGVTDWSSIFYANRTGDVTFPFDVAQYSHRDGLLIPFVQDQAGRTGARCIIIDVGGEAPETLKEAARLATLVVSPVGPDQAELGRIEPTRRVVASVAPDVPHVVLLTRVPVPGAGISAAARRYLTESGYTVANAEVPHNRTRYEYVWGTMPEDVGAYGPVSAELRLFDAAGVGA